MIWEPHYETMSRKDMRAIQLDRLAATAETVFARVPHYKKAFIEHGVVPGDIKSIDDVQKLPFTEKEALAENYPYGMFAVPMKEIVRIHASSGTTGKQKVVGYTKRDIRMWSNMMARLMAMAGVNDEDVAHIAFGYGLFTGGFGLHYGLEKVGATIVPASVGGTEKHINMMQDFGATVLVATPSYALYLAEVAEDMGVDPTRLKLRLGLFGSEPWTENMRQEIEGRWNIKAYDNYGLSEVIGPGVAGECECRNGLHINEDQFYPEIINPETGEKLGYGELGELVFTSLTKEAFPIIRYRTRDIAMLIDEPCECGRTTVRMTRVMGRTDDMLIIRGVNVYPSQIESVLMANEGVSPHYQLIISKKGYLDDLEIQVELSPENFTDNLKKLQALEISLQRKLKTTLSINTRIKLLEPRSIERTTGKAKRVIDLRT